MRHDKKIHLITYGSNQFSAAKDRVVEEAHDFGAFSNVKGYGLEDLSTGFKEEFSDVLSLPRGGGYWIWKYAIIKEYLEEMKDGEFLVYLDAGCKLNPLGKKRFFEYIDLLQNSKYGLLSFQMSGNVGPGSFEPERKWTTRKIFEYFNLSTESDAARTGQLASTVLVIQKSAHFAEILEEWSKALHDDRLLFTDHYNHSDPEPHFVDNRHDQSVLSIIRKIHGSVVIDGDETWMQPFGEGESLKYPFWAARSRN